VRPFLLSAGLALMWFALFQGADVEGDLPAWGIAAVLGTRFLVDLISAWLGVAILRLVLIGGRLGWARLALSRDIRPPAE
jgi:hypothetical protein